MNGIVLFIHRRSMAIYLDDQTRPYLERLVKNIKDTDFIGKRVQGLLKADRERLEQMATCEHIEAEGRGKKTCCLKCGSYYQVGMGEEWELKQVQTAEDREEDRL